MLYGSHSNQILYCIGLREVLCLQVVNTRGRPRCRGAVSEADWGVVASRIPI